MAQYRAIEANMAYRELQGRIQLAEQQIRMYREAMQHLMPGPKRGDSQHRDTDTNNFGASSERATSRRGKAHSWGSQSPLAGQFRGANQAQACVSEDTTTDVVHLDTTSCTASDARPNVVARMHIFGFFGGVVGRVTEETSEGMAELGTDKECHLLLEEIHELESRRAVVSRERELVAKSRADFARCREELLSRGTAEVARRSDLTEARENCWTRKAIYSEQLVRAMNMGALNDSFLIWQQGPFATINGFRLGRLDAHLVDWQEVNAGVGQAAIVLVTVAMAMGVEFSKYLIAPCGSFSKIARSEDGRVLYSLHTDESFSLFPRRNFNLALKAFLHCLSEVGDHVQEHDPTLRLPYHIKEKEGTVGGLPVALVSSLEDWTRALKYMITDLKWVAAWASKYLPPS